MVVDDDRNIQELLTTLLESDGYETTLAGDSASVQAALPGPQPDVVLLDEPFSALDAAMRSSVRAEVISTLKQCDATAVLVTHDQTLAQRCQRRLRLEGGALVGE